MGDDGSKRCDRCETSGQDLLIRCRVDASGRWNMVCGRCWKHVSGGKTDGDAEHPHYAYGGLWKNRRAAKNPTQPPELAGAAAAAAAMKNSKSAPPPRFSRREEVSPVAFFNVTFTSRPKKRIEHRTEPKRDALA